MKAHPWDEIFPMLGRQTWCSRFLSSMWLNERLKVAPSLSRLWFMLLCSPGIWTVALWRQTSIILMSSTYCCWLRFPWCHCCIHTEHILLLCHRFLFTPPPPTCDASIFLINQTFSLLFKGNQELTLKQGCRLANIAWTPFSVEISKRRQKTPWLTWLPLKQCSTFHEGSWCKKKKKINHICERTCSVQGMCYISSLHHLRKVRAYMQDPFNRGLSPTRYAFNNQIFLFRVRREALRANGFLIRHLWGWSQELIVSWSGAPEPIVLEGMKVRRPCWAVFSQQAGVNMLAWMKLKF